MIDPPCLISVLVLHANDTTQERLTAQEAMAHPYFEPVRAEAARNKLTQS